MKLTAKDLMIGDWVYRPDCYDKVVEIRKDTILGSDPLRGLIPITDLQPIPLTAEVLEKNGIRNYSEISEYKVKTNEYEIWVIFDERQNCVHVEKFDKYIPSVYHNVISYVHELQHALRLCGIDDKEIVL